MTIITSLAKKLFLRLTPAKLRMQLKFNRVNFSAAPPILVFQMGKVGSTSILDTLNRMDLGRPIYHAHYLSAEGVRAAKTWHLEQQGKAPHSITYYEVLGSKLRATCGKVRFTIITGAREPIARDISNYFELAGRIDRGLRNDDGSFDSGKIERYFIDRFNRFADEGDHYFGTNWFERELKGTFGIDIYSYPFDQDRGYTVIREDSFDLLVYQFEKMTDIFPDALAQLLGRDDVPALAKSNVGNSKWYAGLYADIKDSIVIPADICKRIYQTKYVKHFYSEEMINRFIEYWSRPRKTYYPGGSIVGIIFKQHSGHVPLESSF